MTRYQMLKKCKDLWKFLEETGSKYKDDYFNSSSLFGCDVPEHDCYACEYVSEREKYGDLCRAMKCPMHDCWTKNKHKKVLSSDFACEEKESPYRKWTESKTKAGRKRYAHIIVAYCNKEIRKIQAANRKRRIKK